MISPELQRSLLDTVQIVAGERLKNVNFTKSYTGVIKSINFENGIGRVEIFGSESECIIPINLISYVDKDDIVIVQDILNNNARKIVQGVIASTNKHMFHIYDDVEDKIVSSVLQLWDEESQKPIDIVFEIE